MKIIFQNESGGISVIVPAPNFSAQDCIKDVPKGARYLLVEDDAIPEDREFRGAWTADFSNAEVA